MPTSASCYGRTIPPRSPLFLSAAAHGHFSLAKINSSKPKLTPLTKLISFVLQLFPTGELRTPPPLRGARYLALYTLGSYPNQKRALTQHESNARKQTD